MTSAVTTAMMSSASRVVHLETCHQTLRSLPMSRVRHCNRRIPLYSKSSHRVTVECERTEGARNVPAVKAFEGILETLCATATIATVASVLTFAPMGSVDSAHAVSGGGGMGTSLAFKDFSGQDMTGKNFNKADMRGVDLTNANLEGDQMFGAICADAKFNGANMRYVDLESADLEGADLSDTILEGAMLTNTQFKKLVSIEGADFTDALIRRDVQKGLCQLPSAKGTNSKTGVSTRESLNCD
jgi:hypothetical protein